MQNPDSIDHKIIQHHFSSFFNNDIDEVMSDYSEESIIITPEKEFYGLEEIRTFFSNAVLLYPKNNTSIVIDKFVYFDNIAYVAWHGETPTFKVEFSTATYLIVNEKIVRHTIGRVIRTKD